MKNSYELWNGKKVVGYLRTDHKFMGKFVKIPYYNKKGLLSFIELPIIFRMIYQSDLEMTCRTCLDVRRKSKYQIEILNKINNEKA